jgi:hypothetical protein
MVAEFGSVTGETVSEVVEDATVAS